MAKGDYYFPLFYKRLLTSTIGWKDDEFGAYLRLLIYQFDNGFIPKNEKDLKRIAPSFKKNWETLSKKFIQDPNGNYVNPVMDEIYKSVQNKKETNKLNGKLGGRGNKKENRTVSENSEENKPNGFKNETETKAIPIINKPIIKEREEEVFFSIEHCTVVALNDERWTKANHTNEKELKEFNLLLEQRGIYQKNPLDYKTHFANWKRTGKKELKKENEPVRNSPPLKKIS